MSLPMVAANSIAGRGRETQLHLDEACVMLADDSVGKFRGLHRTRSSITDYVTNAGAYG